MANPILDPDYVSLLVKKVIYGVTETGGATDSTRKAPSAETIKSPLIIPVSTLWAQSSSLPNNPASAGGGTGYIPYIMARYKGTTAATPNSTNNATPDYQMVTMTQDPTISDGSTWLATATPGTPTSRLSNWIPFSFGSGYAVTVRKNSPTGTILDPNDTSYPYMFDYSAGVIQFPTAAPVGVTSLYVEGYRYIGVLGLSSNIVVADLTALSTTMGTYGTIARLTSDGSAYMYTSSTQGTGLSNWGLIETPWSGITSKPTTLAGYGVTDKLTQGTGISLSNGGTLSGGVTVSITSTITAGTIGSATDSAIVSYNAQGQITAVSSAVITPAFSNITGKPTTLSGYGITDAVNINGGSMTGPLLLSGDPSANLGATTKHYVDTAISNALVAAVFYDGTVDITASPASQTPAIVTPAKGALYRVTTGGTADSGWTGIGGMQNIDIGDYVIWNGSAWDRVENTNPGVTQGTGITVTPTGDTSYAVSITDTLASAGSIGSATDGAVLGYNKQGQITSVSSVTITPAFSNVTHTPTTLAGYGITDKLTQGTGVTLSNGGVLENGVTVSITDTLASAGSIGSATDGAVLGYNKQGQITSVSSVTITPAFSNVTHTPTTLAGYGITDKLTQGTGVTLSNGGVLENGVTVSITDTITAGSIGSATDSAIISYNAQGQITAVSSAAITPAFSNITGKPTTLAGYGIGDALTQGTGITLSNGGLLESGVAVSITDTLGAAGAVGGQTSIPVLGYNAQGQITSVSTASISSSWTAVTDKPTSLAGYGITAGTGLVEDDTSGIVFNLKNQITHGTVGSATAIPVISYNDQGQITSVSTAAISTDFSSLTNRPTTLGGYGIVNDQISEGTGITVSNGGTLDGGVTISLKDQITAGSVGGATSVPILQYNAQGQLTAVSSATISSSSITPDFSNILGKPTTLAGYGITDALTEGVGISLSNSGILENGVTVSLKDQIVAGTIGSSSQIPILGYNAQGQLTSVSSTSISSNIVVADMTTLNTTFGMYGMVAYVTDAGNGEAATYMFTNVVNGTGLSNWKLIGTYDSSTVDSRTYYVTIDASLSPPSTISLGTISSGRKITNVTVQVLTPFNTAATLSVGDATVNDRFMLAYENDLQDSSVDGYTTNPVYITPGVSGGRYTATSQNTNPDVDVKITYTANSATVGIAKVAVSYQ